MGKALTVIFGALGLEAVAPLEDLRGFFAHISGDVDGLIFFGVVFEVGLHASTVDLLEAFLRTALSPLVAVAEAFLLTLEFLVHVLIPFVVFLVESVQHALSLVQFLIELAERFLLGLGLWVFLGSGWGGLAVRIIFHY